MRATKAILFSGALAVAAICADGAGWSGEGPPDATTAEPELMLAKERDFECEILGPLPTYNFTFKNRVLPQHCEMIYYGSCRNSLQCNICDQNRILPKGMSTGPKTFCMKNTTGTEASGTCVPCARCTICKDMRVAWDSADIETDCRVPTVCPDAMDEIENTLRYTVDTFQDKIDILIADAEAAKSDSSEQNQALQEIETLKDALKKELAAEHKERLLIKAELARLQQEKDDLRQWVEDNNANCIKGPQNGGCTNDTFAQMNDLLEKDRLATLQFSLDIASTNKTQLEESLEMLSNIGQKKSDLVNETKEFRQDIDSYLATIEDLRTQVRSSVTIEDNQHAKTIATVFVVLFIITFSVVLVLINRRRNFEATLNRDVKEELMGGGAYGEDDEDTIFARKAPTMNAWDDYDQTDGMRLSEAQENVEVINDVLPGRSPSASKASGELNEVSGMDGQLGYVTKTKAKISESAFGTQTAC